MSTPAARRRLSPSPIEFGDRPYFDESNLDGRVVSGLRRLGITIVTSTQAGTTGWNDDEQLAFAVEHELVLVTSDEGDFERVASQRLALGRTHAGFVVVRQRRLGMGEQIRRLARLASEVEPGDMIDATGHRQAALRVDCPSRPNRGPCS